jgi:diketogulonate reductase-like aldo/keto reductase
MWTRRQMLGLGVGLAMAPRVTFAKDAAMSTPLTRTIPSTGEKIPALGLGSWQTFDVADVAPITPVLATFFARGGRLIDSSPMYGKAEGAIGKMLAALATTKEGVPADAFLATKVWTDGQAAGLAQMKKSLKLFGRERISLMQVHNLLDWKTHLATLRAWKKEGVVKYIGVTHYSHSAFGDLEAIIKREKIDFVQLPYNVDDRLAEQRLLPVARDAGVAVIVMEPFASGDLFKQTKGKALPAVATELGCTSWAQLFLKFLLGHPTVTCPIPATSKVKHVEDNLGALLGPVPDDKQRAAIVAAVAGR